MSETVYNLLRVCISNTHFLGLSGLKEKKKIAIRKQYITMHVNIFYSCVCNMYDQSCVLKREADNRFPPNASLAQVIKFWHLWSNFWQVEYFGLNFFYCLVYCCFQKVCSHVIKLSTGPYYFWKYYIYKYIVWIILQVNQQMQCIKTKNKD